MERKKTRKYLSTALKLILSAAGLYLVFQQVPFDEISQKFTDAHIGFLVLSILALLVAKVLAASRLYTNFHCINLDIPYVKNLKLFLLGLFYNLFLPGGIGGDGYKAYWLTKHYDHSTKIIVATVLLDRINGLTALLFWASLGLYFLPVPDPIPLLGLVSSILIYPTAYLGMRIVFPSYKDAFFRTALWSLASQAMMVVCILFIVRSLGITDNYLAYGVIFLASTIAVLFPFTIGGLGAREMVFYYAAEYLSLNTGNAITASLMFYGIAALVSSFGVYYVLKGNIE